MTEPGAQPAVATIHGGGIAYPEGALAQADAAELACLARNETPRRSAIIRRLYLDTGIDSRHCVLISPEQTAELTSRQSFFPPTRDHQDRGPGTAARMEVYAREAPRLAHAACADALREANLPASAITHLVTVSCTGFTAPGVDLQLMAQLGLSQDVERVHVGFMGCHGAFNGLRVARALAEAGRTSRAAGDRPPVVLLCCVEICSIHHQHSDRADQIVANALFADGAAALVISAAPPARPWHLAAQASWLLPDTAPLMSWNVGDHGFEMTLSPQVPELIREGLLSRMEAWLAPHGLAVEDIQRWAIHPGGPRVLSAAAEALSLPAERWEDARQTFQTFGNMSSPTVLFILQRLRQTAAPLPCVALAFGPGLTIEAALFTG